MSKRLISRPGKKAVHRVLNFGKDLENGVQLGQQQQFDIALVGIHQLERAAFLLKRGKADHHAAEAVEST